jgi:ribosomal protein S28E/S33
MGAGSVVGTLRHPRANMEIVRNEDKQRLIDFLRRKMCGPCRRGDLDIAHEGCVEAAELIVIVEAERST